MYFCTFILRFVVVYGLYMCSAALRCYMIIMHVCLWFGDVASISRICSYIHAFYRLIEVGCYRPPFFDLGCVFRFRPSSLPVFCCWIHLPLDLCLCCCLFLGEDVLRRSEIVTVVVMRSDDAVVVEVIQ
jgi:hypothetical protein